MSWMIIGDDRMASFACDTGMKAFGPLHMSYRQESAEKEMRDFADTLNEDPRKLFRQEKLRPAYIEWRQKQKA